MPDSNQVKEHMTKEEEARLREQAKDFPVTKLPYMGDTFSEDLPEPRPKQTRTATPKQSRRERLDNERRQRMNDIMARRNTTTGF